VDAIQPLRQNLNKLSSSSQSILQKLGNIEKECASCVSASGHITPYDLDSFSLGCQKHNGILYSQISVILEIPTFKIEFLQRVTEMTVNTNFLYPKSHYRGVVQPENLVFNANLQEFAQRVSYITSLETNGKLSPDESYREIRTLWKQLKRSKKHLGIGKKPFEVDDNFGL
jgi:hypothetical protein